jgi:hypothetical protein
MGTSILVRAGSIPGKIKNLKKQLGRGKGGKGRITADLQQNHNHPSGLNPEEKYYPPLSDVIRFFGVLLPFLGSIFFGSTHKLVVA